MMPALQPASIIDNESERDVDIQLWLQPRPWLSLYGGFLRKKNTSSKVPQAPIQQLLPDEIMRLVFSKLSPINVARASLVCQQWRDYARVVYYRYFRFFQDGTLLTRTSPLPVSKVWPSVARMPYYLGGSDSRLPGKWKVKGSAVYTACLYPGHSNAEMRCKLKLRSRWPGLNNRLDVEEIFSYDHESDSRVNLDDPAAEDETLEKNISRRGTNTLVFVHNSEVNTHMINLPKDKMDFWIPG